MGQRCRLAIYSTNWATPSRRTFCEAAKLPLRRPQPSGTSFGLAEAKLGLRGVYTLCPSIEGASSPIVPVVYVCSASTAPEAEQIHRLVWNQDVVPFVIVHTPAGVNLYSGFRHRRLPSGEVDGVLRVLTDFNNISDLVEGFHADAIDSGAIWQKRGKDVTPDTRVDWKLLSDLRKLDGLLQDKDLPRRRHRTP